MDLIPSVLSILVCDQVIIDETTRKKTLVGIFDAIFGTDTPVVQPVGFYARLTDLEGEYKFRIRIVELGDEDEVFTGVVDTTAINCSDRLAIIEIALNLPHVPFPNFGRYEFQLFSNDVYVGRAPVSIVEKVSAA